MKHKHLMILLFGLFFIPSIVFAEELPREGVTYFMTYPNQEEYVTESYEEASNPQERLIYSGITNDVGEVFLDGWEEAGQLRIVQHVPNGYSTDAEEITVNLADKKANFVNYRSNIINPKTGQSILYLFVIVGVVGSFILLKGKKRKLFVILPLFFAGMYFVKADNNSFVITVQDKQGNRLSNVLVDVYAKPIHVEGTPAAKLFANGGKFLDGSDTIYIKLNQSEISSEELFNSMSEEESYELMMNSLFVYRDNYEVSENDDSEWPEVLRNGTVVSVEWQPLSDDNYVITYHGNGGYFTFKNKKITDVKIYFQSAHNLFDIITDLFQKENSHMIGFDNNAGCSRFLKNGLVNNDSDDYLSSSNIYQCWNDHPDGIYVNGKLFIGNDTSCFRESGVYDEIENSYRLVNTEDSSTIGVIITDQNNFIISYAEVNVKTKFSVSGNLFESKLNPYTEKPIESIEVVKDGKKIISIHESDLERISDKNVSSYSYAIQNDEKNSQLLQYFNGVNKDACLNSFEMLVPNFPWSK